MVCPTEDPRHTHTHKHTHSNTHITLCNLALSYLPLSVSASLSFISSISLSIPSRSVFLFFYSSCLLSLWCSSLCFAAFQSSCAWECKQIFDQIVPTHTHTHTRTHRLLYWVWPHFNTCYLSGTLLRSSGFSKKENMGYILGLQGVFHPLCWCAINLNVFIFQN